MLIESGSFLALASPGLHPTLYRELQDAGFGGLQQRENGVCFRGPLAELYRAQLILHSVSRLFLRFEFRAASLEELHRKAQNLPWELFLPALDRQQPVCHIVCHTRNSRISLPVLARRSLAKAIERRCPSNRDISAQWPNSRVGAQRIHLFIEGYRAQVLLDASGSLYQHGYRLRKGKAALREDLAAGLLAHIWQLSQPNLKQASDWFVLDGMCGTATLLAEAAFLWGDKLRPCRVQGYYPFLQWPLRQQATWEYLCRQAPAKLASRTKSASLAGVSPSPNIRYWGLDIDPEQLQCAKLNTEQLSESWQLELRLQDFFGFCPQSASRSVRNKQQANGLLLLNPPYGLRLGNKHQSCQLYKQLAQHLQQQL